MATRVTQVAVETLDKSTVLNARVTQVAVEALDKSTVLKARVTQVAVEVLRKTSDVTDVPPMRVTGLIGA